MSNEDLIGFVLNSSPCNQSHSEVDENGHHAPYKLMFLFFILFIGCLFKTMFAPLRIPYTGVILLLGFIGGILFNTFSTDETFLHFTTESPDLLMAIFLPILVFESAYRIEYHAFMKSFYSILIISTTAYLISIFCISLTNRYLFFFQHWTFLQCLILGIIVSATRPVTLMRQIDYGKTKRLNIFLEGESVINNSLAIIMFTGMKSFVVNDQLWDAMKFFKTISIALIGGMGLGGIAGFLQILGLPYFYDDPISEVTITIAVPYMLYWLCEQMNCSGVVAIAVLGLLLSNYKTAISSEATIFMEKLWDMLTLIANTVIYLLTALTVAELIKPSVQIAFERNTIFLEIGLAAVNYLFCYLIRFGILTVLTLSTKLCTVYHFSWKEGLLVTMGGFKGSICLLLSLAFASELKLVDRHQSSSKFKSWRLTDFTTISPTKYLYMTQCVESLRSLVHDKIRWLKQNKYLANADWIFIETNFRIENTHAVTHPQTTAIELNRTEYEDLFEEARIRILNIQKTSFWRQYRDYEISTESVRILSSLSDFAMDRKGEYISVDQLKYYYKPRTLDFVWKYLGRLVKKVHVRIDDNWRKYQKIPEDKWCLLCFTIVNHRRFSWFITCIILLNVVLAIIRIALNVSHEVHFILTVIQSAFVVIYLFESIVKMYTFGIRAYFRTWIDYRVEFILLVFAAGECIFEYYQLTNSTFISRRTWSILQILILIQIFRFSRLIQSVFAYLNTLLERLANRYVTRSLELCRAYIISEDDVLSKLRRIIEIDQIREQFHQESIRRRNEIIMELTFIQREYPNVSASVKTNATVQKLLNYSKNMIHHMTSKGLLGENEAHRLTENINQRLHTNLVPPVLSFPIPLNFLYVFPWLHDPDVLEYILSRLRVQLFSLNEYIYKANDDAQAIYFITAGYVETVRSTSKSHNVLSTEKNDSFSQKFQNANDQVFERKSFSNEDFFQWSDDESNTKDRSILAHLNIDDSTLNLFPEKDSTLVRRMLHAPGDILGQIDLLNGQKYTETCKCVTNTLIWYLKSNDLFDLIERFHHLRILEKLWHYTALQLAEAILYEYLNTIPSNTTEQEYIHIYGHLKRAFLIPESYLLEHEIIYSSHELILIQGQLQNIVSSLIYTAPCFIQIEFGQCGLKPLNIFDAKILVLRSPHPAQHDEFLQANDLPDLFAHVIYDDKLNIFLPRIDSNYKHVIPTSNTDGSSSEMSKKTLLGRFLESLPRFQRRAMNS
ncbi:unnamed protein product [Adineta ricciae]|uniref:Cyclic nucleotide-binding domain-containing protein n=1 Tax=Adineta ricciae TaxID=249248 RepID=A0A815WA32_ADIRI|nr:unnamed protein product [Adineta ricciae]